MLTRLDQGARVDIRISGASVHNVPGTAGRFFTLEIDGDADRPRYLQIPEALLTDPHLRIEVTRCAPAEYPPVAGDVWQSIECDEVSAPTYWAAARVDDIQDGPFGVRLICLSYHENGSGLLTPEELLLQGRLTLLFPSPLRSANGGEQPVGGEQR